MAAQRVVRAGECECQQPLGGFARGGVYWFQELLVGRDPIRVFPGSDGTVYTAMTRGVFEEFFTVKEK